MRHTSRRTGNQTSHRAPPGDRISQSRRAERQFSVHQTESDTTAQIITAQRNETQYASTEYTAEGYPSDVFWPSTIIPHDLPNHARNRTLRLLEPGSHVTAHHRVWDMGSDLDATVGTRSANLASADVLYSSM